MPLDFGKLTQAGELGPLTRPQDIFNSLPAKQPGYGYLRDVQGRILDAWYARRAESSLVAKMNTGSGKTIAGLLVLQSCLAEKAAPALYVAPNNYLAEQVRDEAARLGIATTDDPESAKYLTGRAIGVVNIHKLFNGLSVFGGPGNPRASRIPIGSVVIDDAHAALATTTEQFTITLPSEHPAYGELLKRFAEDLRGQSASGFFKLENRDRTGSALRVPFWAWADASADVIRILHKYQDYSELKFVLPLLDDILPICHAVFTADNVEIQPPCLPVNEISQFAGAHRRIYLTATLADDSVLVTSFDAAPASIAEPITPPTAADIGDRMILAPQEINPSISDDDIRQMLRALADERNVVVLVPSERRAAQWASIADATTAADTIAPLVERLRSTHVGLTVLINKYDGIDLPGKACEVLVIDGLPEVYSGIARRERLLLADSDALLGRQLQRVEQGMGRGVRSAEDHCVVILLGARLTQLIAHPDHEDKWGPATRAQFKLSRQMADILEGTNIDEIVSVIGQCLHRDQGWVQASRAALAGTAYTTRPVDATAIHMRAAFNAAASVRYADAATEMSKAVDEADNDLIKGWLKEQLAVYIHPLDAAKAMRVQSGALKLNPRVLRPPHGATYRLLTPTHGQAQAAARYLTDTYTDGTDLQLGVKALLDDLLFDPDRTDAFEDAIERLASHLGLSADRPERYTGNGPDVLWALGQTRYLVIECKSGATADKVKRADVEQLAHSMSWFHETYDHGCTATPVLVHPSNVLRPDASASPGTRIVTTDKLQNLHEAVRAACVALATAGTWNDADAVATQLRHHELTARNLTEKYARLPRAAT